MRHAYSCLALAGLSFCQPVAAVAQSTIAVRPTAGSEARLAAAIPAVDALFSAAYGQDPVGSMTIGIIAGPRLIWTRSYGMADMARRVPATRDTVYRIGSITKEFTGVMLMQLAAQGRVHYSEPVEKYFPLIKTVRSDYPYASPITLQQLATHMSGLDREPDPYEAFVVGPVATWKDTLVAALPHLRYAYEPGTRYNYSNIGFAILGAALEQAAGEPYTAYVTRNILTPLGMTHTAFEPDAAIRKRLARGYEIVDGRPDPSAAESELATGRGYKVPNGALFTTVDDLARFVSFQMGDAPDGVVLAKAKLTEAMSRLQSADTDLTDGYGLAFEVSRQDGVVMSGHGGAVAGYRAYASFSQRHHVGIVILRSAADPGTNIGALTAKSLAMLTN